MESKGESEPAVLVIGATGFLGRALVKALLPVYNSVRTLSRTADAAFDELPGVEHVVADIRFRDGLIAACAGVRTVFHLAAATSALASDREIYEVNVTGTSNVIDACLHAGVQQLIFTSSSSVVISNVDIFDGDEKSTPFPKVWLDEYSRTKGVVRSHVQSLGRALTPFRLPSFGGTARAGSEREALL